VLLAPSFDSGLSGYITFRAIRLCETRDCQGNWNGRTPC
jgi:hypothetical protein